MTRFDNARYLFERLFDSCSSYTLLAWHKLFGLLNCLIIINIVHIYVIYFDLGKIFEFGTYFDGNRSALIKIINSIYHSKHIWKLTVQKVSILHRCEQATKLATCRMQCEFECCSGNVSKFVCVLNSNTYTESRSLNSKLATMTCVLARTQCVVSAPQIKNEKIKTKVTKKKKRHIQRARSLINIQTI